MASTYSTSLRLELVGDGEQSGAWGVTTNRNLGTLIEDALAGVASVTHDDSASYSLTELSGVADESRNMIQEIGGTLTANRNVVVPDATKLYVVKNATAGGFSITVKTSAGTGVTIPNGDYAIVYSDGTNVVSVVTVGDLASLNTVSTSQIDDDAVTNAKMADDSVDTAEIVDGAVTAAKLASDAVTTVKILDDNVTTAKIAAANVTATELASDAVTTAKILDANVTTAKIADENVTLAKMAQLGTDGFIGNDAGASAVPQLLTGTEATAILDAMVADSGSGGTKGLVPAPGTGDGTAGKESYLTGAATYIRPIWHPIGEYVLSGDSTPYAITGLTDWDMLEFELLINPSADGDIICQVGYGATPTWYTGSTDYRWISHALRMNSGDSLNGSSQGLWTDTGIDLNSKNIFASSPHPFTCTLKWHNWTSVSDYRQCSFQSAYYQSEESNFEVTNGTGALLSTTNALTAIRFSSAGGGTFTGHITVQGRKIG